VDNDGDAEEFRGKKRREAGIAAFAKNHVRVEFVHVDKGLQDAERGFWQVENVFERKVAAQFTCVDLLKRDAIFKQHPAVVGGVRHEEKLYFKQTLFFHDSVDFFRDGDNRVKMSPRPAACHDDFHEDKRGLLQASYKVV